MVIVKKLGQPVATLVNQQCAKNYIERNWISGNKNPYTMEEVTAIEHPIRRNNMVKALKVIILTPHIREYLEQSDPKALEQCLDALGE